MAINQTDLDICAPFIPLTIPSVSCAFSYSKPLYYTANGNDYCIFLTEKDEYSIQPGLYQYDLKANTLAPTGFPFLIPSPSRHQRQRLSACRQ